MCAPLNDPQSECYGGKGMALVAESKKNINPLLNLTKNGNFICLSVHCIWLMLAVKTIYQLIMFTEAIYHQLCQFWAVYLELI